MVTNSRQATVVVAVVSVVEARATRCFSCRLAGSRPPVSACPPWPRPSYGIGHALITELLLMLLVLMLLRLALAQAGRSQGAEADAHHQSTSGCGGRAYP